MLFFRTRSEGKYGWGNIARLSWIAKHLKDTEKLECNFLIEGSSKSETYIKNLGLNVLICKKKISIKEEIQLLKKFNIEIKIIVEMLDFQYDHQLTYKNENFKVIILDDLLEQRYCSNVVICGQQHSKHKTEIIRENFTKFYYGYEYFPISPSLNKIKNSQKKSFEKKKIGVFLGGVPYTIALLKIARSLKEFENILEINFVIGFGRVSKIKKEIKALIPNAFVYDTVDVDKFLSSLNFAIVGGGYSKIEAYLYRIPSLIVSTQYHQIPLAEIFSVKTNQKYLGHALYLNNKLISENVQKLIKDEATKIDFNLLLKLQKSFDTTVKIIKKELELKT